MLKIITTFAMFALALVEQTQVSEIKKVSPTKIKIINGVELLYTTDHETAIKTEDANASALQFMIW